jgi:hypothetical protein
MPVRNLESPKQTLITDLLLTTYCLLLTAYCLLLTAYCLLPSLACHLIKHANQLLIAVQEVKRDEGHWL